MRTLRMSGGRQRTSLSVSRRRLSAIVRASLARSFGRDAAGRLLKRPASISLRARRAEDTSISIATVSCFWFRPNHIAVMSKVKNL